MLYTRTETCITYIIRYVWYVIRNETWPSESTHGMYSCTFAGSIKVCCKLTGLFSGDVDSFAGLFDEFYYIFTGESTSKADKFDNLRSMKILNTILTQKSPGIRTKRAEWRGTRELNEEEQNLQTKKGAISQPRRMRTPPEEQPATLVNFGGCFSTGVLFLTVVGLETTQQRNHPGGEEFWGGSILTIKLKMFEARLIRWSPNAHLYTSIFVWDCVQPKDPHAATHCNTQQDTATH